MKIHLPNNKKVYFASDQHFGLPNHQESLVREKRFVQWLDTTGRIKESKHPDSLFCRQSRLVDV